MTKITERDKYLVLAFDKPNYVVKLYEYLLEVDLKEGIRTELEDVLEDKSFLKESLGFIFQTVVPVDVWLKDIESASVCKDGRAKIVIPHHKDITIPLSPDESKKLVGKLNELIPTVKKKDLEDREIRRRLHAKF
ncbi:MAG: hypothetical protein OEY88_06675 [Candidatus Bathyarchaeota archaeon]|nr:hypothetical protein [Candidatus Bathyarchaeota archaeon]